MTDKAEIEALVERFDLQQPDSHMGSAYMQSEPGHGDWVRYSDHEAALPDAAEKGEK